MQICSRENDINQRIFFVFDTNTFLNENRVYIYMHGKYILSGRLGLKDLKRSEKK